MAWWSFSFWNHAYPCIHWKRPLDLNCHQCMGQHILSYQSIPSNRTTSRRFRSMQHSHQKYFTRIYTTCSPSIHACDYRPISNPNSRNHQLWNIRCGLLFGIFWIKFTNHFRVPYNRRIPFSDGCLAAYKIKTFPFHLMTPAYVDIGFWLFRGLGLDASVLTENYGA